MGVPLPRVPVRHDGSVLRSGDAADTTAIPGRRGRNDPARGSGEDEQHTGQQWPRDHDHGEMEGARAACISAAARMDRSLARHRP